MDEQTRTALANLARPGWRIEWRDYRVFENFIGYFIESAECSDRLPDAIARELIERGYVTQVDDNDPREWRRTYVITDNGREALVA